MNSVETHAHNFPDSEWPFSDPDNVVAISTIRVFRENFPILRVSHDRDGDWQILCDTTVETKDAIIVCLGCAYQRDQTIGELADLPMGWTAWRDYIGGPWIREQKMPEDET